MKNLRYTILGSGSTANSYHFENDEWAFVIDNGFSLREFKKRALQAELDLKKIRFILLTHEHGDHLRGVKDLAVDLKVPVVHHESIQLERIFRPPLPAGYSLVPGREYNLDSCRFVPFSLHHDAPHPLSVHFQWEGGIFTLITDTGCTNDEMLELASRSHVVFLEANYCPDMLKNGPYPWPLKNRISGDKGHLSNVQAVDFLNRLGDRFSDHRIQKVYLVHLSETNNHPDAVAKTMKEGLRHSFSWEVCPKSALVKGQPISL